MYAGRYNRLNEQWVGAPLGAFDGAFMGLKGGGFAPDTNRLEGKRGCVLRAGRWGDGFARIHLRRFPPSTLRQKRAAGFSRDQWALKRGERPDRQEKQPAAVKCAKEEPLKTEKHSPGQAFLQADVPCERAGMRSEVFMRVSFRR